MRISKKSVTSNFMAALRASTNYSNSSNPSWSQLMRRLAKIRFRSPLPTATRSPQSGDPCRSFADLHDNLKGILLNAF